MAWMTGLGGHPGWGWPVNPGSQTRFSRPQHHNHHVLAGSHEDAVSNPPFPDSLDDLRIALWRHLKAAAEKRRAASAEPGQRFPVDPSVGGGSTEVKSDVPLGGTIDRFAKVLFGREAEKVSHARTIEHRFETVIHELIMSGILRGDRPPNAQRDYFLTPHGMACLEQDTLQLPLLPDAGRVDKLSRDHQDFPNIDVIVRHYREALAAYLARLDLSATVMIGVCYEAIENTLASAISDFERRHQEVGSKPGLRAKVAKGEYVPAGRVTAAVTDALPGLKGLGLDNGLVRWGSDTRVPLVALTQSLRNAAGHPTGVVFDRDEIATRLLMLHEHMRRATELLAFLRR